MMQTYTVPGTDLVVLLGNGMPVIRNNFTGNILYGDRVRDTNSGKRFQRDALIKQARAASQVATVQKKERVTSLQNNTVAVDESGGNVYFYRADTTLSEVASEINGDFNSLDDYRFIDLVTMKEIQIVLAIETL